MKNIKRITAIFSMQRLYAFIVLALLTATSVASAQTTYYVNDLSTTDDVYTSATGNDANPGTAASPFLTISHALSVAIANDIILVDAGTYNEHVLIDKPIDLRGAKYGLDARSRLKTSGESILDGTGLSGSPYDAIMIDDAVSGVSIDGFEIANYSGSGFNGDGNAISSYCMGASTTGASNVSIYNNYIHDIAYNGILVGSENTFNSSMVMQSGFDIRYNMIETYTYAGIELTNTINSQVRDNDIAAPLNRFDDPGDAGVGIEIAARSRNAASSVSSVTVRGNVLTGAFPTDSRAAINILSRAYKAASNASLTGVTVDGNTVTGATNIRSAVLAVAEARNTGPASISNLTVSNNTLTGNTAGMSIQDFLNGGTTASHSNVSVYGNTITNSISNGFGVESGTSASGILVNDNVFTGNGTYAVKNDGSGTLDATCNWYGSTVYSTVTANIAGSNITYVPYLISGTDDQPASPGFQPLSGACIGTTANLAIAYYTGMTFASTSGSSGSTATVTLSATIKDLCAVDGDFCPGGDITTAQVRFVNRELLPSDPAYYLTGWLTVGLIQQGNSYAGAVTANVVFNIGTSDAKQFIVGIVVGGDYTRDNSADDAIITVAKPLTSFVSGGGYIVLTNSSGMKAGDTDTRANFGFNTKYNSKMTNLLGSANIIFRRTETDGLHTYQIKGSNMTSLSVVPATTTSPARAVLACKASIRDITDPLSPVSIDGNATMQLTMTDLGEPGKMDAIAMTVWNKAGGLWFTSNWNGTRTVEQLLSAGNLKVHPSATTNGNVTTTLTLTSSSATNTTAFGTSVTFTAQVVENNSAKPTGAVLFYDGTTLLGYVPVSTSGTASFTTSVLTIGTHPISAYYGGDTKFKSSTSATINHTVTTPRMSDDPTVTLSTQPEELKLTVFNNPSTTSFGIAVGEAGTNQRAVIRIMTLEGKTVEIIDDVPFGVRLDVGGEYPAGIYVVVVDAIGKHQSVRLIKLN